MVVVLRGVCWCVVCVVCDVWCAVWCVLWLWLGVDGLQVGGNNANILFHIDACGGGGEVGWGGGGGGTDGDGGGGGGVSGGGSGGGMHVHVRVRVIRKFSNTPRGMHSSTVTTSVAGTAYNNLARSHGLQQLDLSTTDCWISPQETCNIAT